MSGGRRRVWALALAALLWLLAACAPVAPQARTGTAAQPEPLLVAAASDLQFAFAEIAERFTAETGQPVSLVFGSTGNLTAQIENGAPFDVFAAANVSFVDRLAEKGMVLSDTQRLYARGRIVLVVNRQSGVQAATLEDLINPAVARVAIANPEHAPYGQAAREALQNAGVWEAIQDKLVMGENVSQTLQFVQTGNAPAGIVALSIADAPEVIGTLVPDDLHAPLDQALAVIAGRPYEDAARAFASFVLGPAGREILSRHGFTPPGAF